MQSRDQKNVTGASKSKEVSSIGRLLQDAVAAHKKGDLLSAENGYRNVLAVDPRNADANQNLGMLAKQSGHLPAAIQLIGNAVAIDGSRYTAYFTLGDIFELQGNQDKAIQCYRQALKIKPDFIEAYNNLGLLLKKLHRYDEAIACYSQAVRIKPNCAYALANLGNVLKDAGKIGEAISVLRKSVYNEPPSLGAYSNLLLASNYSSDLSRQEVFDLHCQFETYASKFVTADRFDFSGRKSNAKLRIGYVSPDLNTHSVAYFAEPLFKHHDKETFEVFVYYSNTRRDETNMRFRDYADCWRDVASMSDIDLADQVYADNIDILVDLAGHSANNRLAVFVQKPAPIQVAWLGYPNTTGLSQIDYRLTDSVADPVGEADEYHTEKLVRLDDGFLSFQAEENDLVIAPAPCLQNGYLTFGSFNNLVKVTDDVIEAWAELLKAVPDSRLILKSGQLGDAGVKQRILEGFSSYGISADRIDLYGALPKRKDHLALYSQIDIGLDPFPYNGTTTTCEALWMGVPTLSIVGEEHASRVGASILTQVGLEQFMATDRVHMLAMAKNFSMDSKVVAELRAGMRDTLKRSALLDHATFTANVEQLFLSFQDAGSRRDSANKVSAA